MNDTKSQSQRFTLHASRFTSHNVTSAALALMLVVLPVATTPQAASALQYDEETGLYYNRARAYNPTLGRFIQRDPNETAMLINTALLYNAQSYWASLGIAPGGQYLNGMNLFEYLGSNPLNRTDPMGLYWDDYDIWDEVDDAIYGLTTERIAALGAAAEKAGMAINIALMVGQAALSFIPGGEAVLLAGKLAAGADISFDDLGALALGIGGAGLAYKGITKLAAYFRRARSMYKVGKRACFVAGTLIMLHDGSTIPIEKVQVGDYVMSDVDPEHDNSPEPRKVVDVFERTVNEVLDLIIVDSDGKQHTITTTPEHPFYDARRKRFVEIKDLAAGDALVSTNGTLSRINTKRHKAGSFKVYNFEVEEAHNYFVSCTPQGPDILVHNACQIKSLIGLVPGLKRYADRLSGDVQRGVDSITRELSKGNLNPGTGNKYLFDGIFESRGRGGARVYWRNVREGIVEILAKSNKGDQNAVIGLLRQTYGK